MKSTDEEEELDELAGDVAAMFVDALLIRSGLSDEPTTELGKMAYAKYRSKDT